MQRNAGRSSARDVPKARWQRLTNSGYLTPALLALLSFLLLLVAYNHRRGNFHRLRSVVLPQSPLTPPPLSQGPGGQPPLRISRSSTSLGVLPEFVSVTMLPGRGFQVLQITASIPGHGELNLLHVPEGADLDALFTDKDGDAFGTRSTQVGAPFLAPWAGHIHGVASDDGGLVTTSWEGQHLRVPGEPNGRSTESVAGLMLDRPVDSVTTSLLPDGQKAQALSHAGNFGNHWPSSVDIRTDVQLTARTILLTLTAKNVGNVPTPVGLGWRPILSVVSGDRADASLIVPSQERLTLGEEDRPTGRVEQVAGTPQDLSSSDAVALMHRSIDATYVGLQRASTADGPMVVFDDPGSDYGLRLTAVDGDSGSLHVIATPGEPWVTLGFGSNREDPFGSEWKEDEGGMRVLQPGESMSWRMRLEIFRVPHRTVSSDFTP